MMTPSSPPKRILVGVDYGPLSVTASALALDLAATFGASVHLLNAWAAPYAQSAIDVDNAPHNVANHNLLELIRQGSAASMEAFLAQFDTSRLEVDWFVESGDPRVLLLQHAKHHECDWIIVGSHGREGIRAWLLGSVALHIVRHAAIPVVVVPGSHSRGAQS